MKKIFLAVLLSAGLFSCSNDDSNSAPFFDYAVGDVWAYKYYNRNAQGEFIASSSIDTVKIVGTQVFDDKTYFNFETTTYSATGIADTPVFKLMRVDENGHLAGIDYVVHPGKDVGFTEDVPFYVSSEQKGTITSILKPESTTINVGGINYKAYNYQGYFVPLAEGYGVEGLGSETYYSPGVGLVKQVSRYISSPEMSIEYRLEYHN